MVYMVLNFKGGVGKSTFASNLIAEYILQKGKQETIKLFEFDEYSQTSKDYLKNSELIESTIISEEEIDVKVFNILFNSIKEDVIIDVGPGAFVTKIVAIAKKSLNLDKLIFVVPYSDDAPSALLATVELIEITIDNPKILVVLNKIPDSSFRVEDTKKSTISLYGNEQYGIKPYEHLDRVDKYIRATVPYDYSVFTFAKAEKTSLIELKRVYLETRDLTPEELEKFWKASGNIKGKEATKKEYVDNMIAMQRQLHAAIFLEKCSEFYKELRKLESSK